MGTDHYDTLYLEIHEEVADNVRFWTERQRLDAIQELTEKWGLDEMIEKFDYIFYIVRPSALNNFKNV